MVFYEEARVNFDLVWNYLEGGVSFLSIRYLKDSDVKNLLPSRLILLAKPLSLNYSANRSAGGFHIMRQYIFEKKI